MDFEEYKKTCGLYKCYYRMTIGFVFVIYSKKNTASIILSPGGTVKFSNYKLSDFYLFNKIKEGKTKEELDEFLSKILAHEILNLRKEKNINNLIEEVNYFFGKYHNIINPIIESINETLKTDVMPYEILEKYRIRFLLNSNIPSYFFYVMQLISLYKFINDDNFIKIN